MSYFLAKYRKSDFKRITWAEYGELLNSLYGKVVKHVKENRVKIDAVVPISRGGLFPGTYLAYRLNILRILPVQYHYFFMGKKLQLRRILWFARNEVKQPRPVFLLAENNHCFGVTAATAARDLRKQFPGCRIIYAADHIDYSYRNAVRAQAVLCGRFTNETRALTKKQCTAKGIFPLSYLFPWESLKEEWETVSSKQFEYSDLKSVLGSSKLKKTIKL